MAEKKSKAYPYQWPNGSWHSITWAAEQARQSAPSTPGFVPSAFTRGIQAMEGRVAAGQPASAAAAPVTTTGPLIAGYEGPGPQAASPQPVDPALEEQRLIANRNVALGRGEAAYNQGNLGFDYGYNPNGTINTANPYSRAAMLQLGYEHQQAGTTNSYAAQGQLYSGAIQNALGEGSRQYGANEAANRLAYQRATHGIQAGQLNTVANAGSGVSDADFQALLKATYPGG